MGRPMATGHHCRSRSMIVSAAIGVSSNAAARSTIARSASLPRMASTPDAKTAACRRVSLGSGGMASCSSWPLALREFGRIVIVERRRNCN